MNSVWKWTKWPALGYVLAQPVLRFLIDGKLPWWQSLIFLLNIYCWHQVKDAGDDDFTKKLKERLKEKIVAIEGKLVVVPERA